MSEDVGVATEAALPQLSGQHDVVLVAGCVFIRAERAADDRLDAHHGKEVVGNEQPRTARASLLTRSRPTSQRRKPFDRAGLEAESIAYPVRGIVRRYRNVAFRMARVRSIDLQARTVLADGLRVHYDYLVLALGSANNYFGNDALAAQTLGLKDIDDAEDCATACSRRSSRR